MAVVADYSLRLADRQDIDAIMRLERAGFARGVQEQDAVFLERIATWPEGFLLLEDRVSREAIGYACSERWDFEEQPDPARFKLGHRANQYHCRTGTELYLSSMTIDPKHRGSGLGAFLCEACIERQAQRFALRSAILIVNETWAHGRHLYRRNGFREIGRIEAFFEPGNAPPQAAVMMRKTLG